MATEFQIRTITGQRSLGTEAAVDRADLEIESMEMGYAFPARMTVTSKADHDVGLAYMSNWVEMAVSHDEFVTIDFWGYVNTNNPLGITREGIRYEVIGLEAMLNNYVMAWNNMTAYVYNPKNIVDWNSPKGTRWTLKQIIHDVLEHMFGVPAVDAITYPYGSAIYPHHQRTASGMSTTRVPLSRAETGTEAVALTVSSDVAFDFRMTAVDSYWGFTPASGMQITQLAGTKTGLIEIVEEWPLAFGSTQYFISLADGSTITAGNATLVQGVNTYEGPTFIWDRAAIDALTDLDITVPEQRFVTVRCWDLLTQLVELSSDIAIFLNPNYGSDTIEVVFHDWSDSTGMTVSAPAIRSTHVDTDTYNLIDNDLKFSLDSVRTHVIIEGRGSKQESSEIDLVPAWKDHLGAVIDASWVGKRWVVKDHRFVPLLPGAIDATKIQKPGWTTAAGPLVKISWDDWTTVDYCLETVDYRVALETGEVTFSTSILGGGGAIPSLKLHSLYAAPFRVEAGPGGDAFTNYNYISQLVIYDEDLLHYSRGAIAYYSAVTVDNPCNSDTIRRKLGKLTIGSDPASYSITYPGSLRNDTPMMQALADKMLDRLGNERKTGTVTITMPASIDPYTILRQKVNFTGLQKWSAIGLQIMRYRIDPKTQQMTLTVSNQIDRAPNWPYEEWKRRMKGETAMNAATQLIKQTRTLSKVGAPDLEDITPNQHEDMNVTDKFWSRDGDMGNYSEGASWP